MADELRQISFTKVVPDTRNKSFGGELIKMEREWFKREAFRRMSEEISTDKWFQMRLYVKERRIRMDGGVELPDATKVEVIIFYDIPK